MSNPHISVLIPTYNAGKYLDAALNSVYAQTYRDFEVIVVDDGSEDGTESVVARYPDVLYKKCPHRGISATRNECLALAKGTWIAFLDADDLWHPEKLQKQVAYLEEHPECRILFSVMRNFMDEAVTDPTPVQRTLLSIRDECYCPSALIHRSLFDTVGNYWENLRIGEDSNWLLRLKSAGVDVRHRLEEVLYFRRVHSSNISLTYLTGTEALRNHASTLRWMRKKADKESKT